MLNIVETKRTKQGIDSRRTEMTKRIVKKFNCKFTLFYVHRCFACIRVRSPGSAATDYCEL